MCSVLQQKRPLFILKSAKAKAVASLGEKLWEKDQREILSLEIMLLGGDSSDDLELHLI